MELRRALLLFAIVLGIAAVVTLLAGGSRDDREATRQAPATRPAPSPATPSPSPAADGPKAVQFAAAGPPARKSAVVGQPAIVRVSSDEAGDVELRGLGLLAPVEPSVPARFDVLADAPGRYRVTFVPAGGTDARAVGTLVVRAAAE